MDYSQYLKSDLNPKTFSIPLLYTCTSYMWVHDWSNDFRRRILQSDLWTRVSLYNNNHNMSVLVTSFHPLILKAHQLIFFLFHFRPQLELTYPYRPSSNSGSFYKKFSYGYYDIEFHLMKETLIQNKRSYD